MLLMPAQSLAIGQLMVSPTRIVFEGSTRTEQVTLINNSSETGRYRISFVRRKMTDAGDLQEVGENEPGFYSDEMIRFSPRQVTLPPGQSQTIRLMLRKPANLETGEYRSHLMLQSLPDPGSTDVGKLAGQTDKTLTIELIPVVGITIPVIVRHGKLASKASLSDFNIELTNQVNQQPDLKLRIHRTGTASIYGDIRVDFTANGSEDSISVGQANGVAVYTPNAMRDFSIKLQAPANVKLAKGKLRISYIETGKDAKTGMLAEAALTLP
jgi:P pilus assembly chaperone PapD